MQEQILFLGSAGDAFILNKAKRTAAGIIVQTPDGQIHINPGPCALAQARAANIDTTKTMAVVVTDNTLLHSHDANLIVYAMTMDGFDEKGILLAAKSALEGECARISKEAKEQVEKTIIFQEGAKVECNNIHIEAIKIKNKDPYAVGLKIITKNFSLGYTNKTKYTASLRDKLKDVEILILELPLARKTTREEGLSIEEAQKLIAEIKPQLAVLTGFGLEMAKQDLLELTRSMQKATGVQTTVAQEKFSLDPLSYAVKLRQKRLVF